MKNVMKRVMVVGLLIGSAGMVKPTNYTKVSSYLKQAEDEIGKGLDNATQKLAHKYLLDALKEWNPPINRFDKHSYRAKFIKAMKDVKYGRKEQALSEIKKLQDHVNSLVKLRNFKIM